MTMTTKFDIKEDNRLISQGTHFFCLGHLSAVPITEQSTNLKYCRECYAVIKQNNGENNSARTDDKGRDGVQQPTAVSSPPQQRQVGAIGCKNVDLQKIKKLLAQGLNGIEIYNKLDTDVSPRTVQRLIKRLR